jgi:hypothetical protein
MVTLEPEIAAQLKIFEETIVLPTFKEIRASLEPLGYQMWTTTVEQTGDNPFDELLHGLIESSGACFLADLDSIDSVNAIWQKPYYLVAALMVQLPKELLVFQPLYEDRFCLGVQCDVSPEKNISAKVLVLYGKRDGTFSCFQAEFDPKGQDPPIATLTPAHILGCFTDSFAGFRTQALEEPEPTPEIIPKLAPEPTPETKAIPLPASPSPSPASEPSTKQTIDLAPQAKPSPQEESSQRGAVSQFLQSLDVKRSLWPDDVQGRDLERLVEWSSAVQNLPAKTFAHQMAHQGLNSQAAQFAMLLKPQSALIFTDYFELYRSAVYRLCMRSAEAGADGAQVFIEQVKALRDPKAPQRANPQKLEEVHTVFRSVARQFGKPDEFMLHEWIGESCIEMSIHALKDLEPVVSGIQNLSKKRLVKFGRLSWGVLQVYQNEEILLSPETSPGRNGVERFLYSAWQTIQKPIGEISCVRHRADEVELSFSRRLVNGGRERMARARVVVYGTHGWVFLHSYGFEED